MPLEEITQEHRRTGTNEGELMESNQPRRAWRVNSRVGRRGRAQGPGRLGFLTRFPQALSAPSACRAKERG